LTAATRRRVTPHTQEGKVELTQHYDPNQPRVPAGHHDGGQWTGGGSGLLDAILGPRSGDGRTGIAQLGPSLAPGGLAATNRLEQLIAGADTHQAFAPGFADPRRWVIQKALEAGLALFTWLSARNSRQRHAIIEFKAHDYEYARDDAPGSQFELRAVRLLAKEEVKKVCKKLDEVQELTDEAVLNTIGERSEMSPTQYGTAIHKYVSDVIGDKDPNFKAEESFLKLQEEMKQNGEVYSAKPTKYGKKNSIRIDVFERRDQQTVCVYDLKTGLSGLSTARRTAILTYVHGTYPGATHIVIAEVRPTDQWRPR
jgi:hypothetical protein